MDILLSIARASELPVFMNCDLSVATNWALSLVEVDQSPIQDISQHYIFRVGDREGLCKGERTGNVTEKMLQPMKICMLLSIIQS